MQTIKIMDPVTRIEGHMKVEVAIDTDGGQSRIVDAKCTGTLFRGFETLLKGRQPIDATVITQRICGVCPISHGHTSVMALENVSGWVPPTNGRLLRNLTLGANFIQSHILHFYLLALWDFAPGPAVSPWSPVWNADMRNGLQTVSGNLPGALDARRRAHEMGAIFGGRMPTSHTFVPGGFTSVPTSERVAAFRDHLQFLAHFIDSTYIPDVQAVSKVYGDYFKIGAGCGNLMAYGVFEMDDSGLEQLLNGGYYRRDDGRTEPDLRSQSITESVRYSWYEDRTSNLSPEDGETAPAYPKGDAYSWLKAPRLMGEAFEVGPLARMWVNKDYQRGISVMDRHLARAYETLKVARAMEGWLNELQNDVSGYDETYDQYSGVGVGMSEAPRGALGHWVNISNDGKIAHYQVITPTCWNASPRDDGGIPGPMEQALIGTPVKDPDQPVEALRVIHSYDPCLSCAVHVMRPEGKPQVIQAGLSRC